MNEYEIIYIITYFILLFICLHKIFNKSIFKNFDKRTWIIIVVLFSIVGEILYLVFEDPMYY